jgi:hypothetical protein
MHLAPKRCVKMGSNLVRISDDARDCSVFLGFSSGDDFQLEGSGFFVGYPGGAGRSIFLATAAHVAKKLKDTPFAVRMNADDGAARVVEIDEGHWIFHPDKNVDIAVLPFDCPDWAKRTIKTYPISEFMDDEREKLFDIGAGDAVQIVGLFHPKQLKKKNLPIVHTGHIALFPSDESFSLDKGQDKIEVRGYLVEASCLEGSSGSPAYVRRTVNFEAWADGDHVASEKTFVSANGRIYLLGVWVGAWPGKPDEALQKGFALPKGIMVPVGMGIVIPAERLMEILKSPEIEVMRTEAIQIKNDAIALKPLALPIAAPAIAANPTHREDFTSLLDAAAKKHPQGD